MSLTTNAYTSLEWAFTHKLSDQLTALSFPFDRIELSVNFKDSMMVHSDVSIKVDEPVEPQDLLSGRAVISFNSLFLSQDPVSFFEHVLIHEVAHVFAEIIAIKNGRKIKKHGPEWQDYMYKMSDNPILDSKVESELFDNRASISRSGGCVASCDCPDTDYIAFGIRSAEYKECASGELACGVCSGTYRIIPPSNITGPLHESIRFLHIVSGYRKDQDLNESPLISS